MTEAQIELIDSLISRLAFLHDMVCLSKKVDLTDLGTDGLAFFLGGMKETAKALRESFR